MNILSFDGSNNNLSIALQQNNQFIINENFPDQHNQSESLVSLIDLNLKKFNLDYKDLDLIAIANGPANFTGIRIQFTIAKMIKLIAKVPVVTVGSLEAFAYEYRNQSHKIVAIIDAKLGEFFVQEFEYSKEKFIGKYPPKLLRADDIENILPKDDFLIVGNSNIKSKNAKYLESSNLVKCNNIILLAQDKYKKDNSSFSNLSYMREPSISKRK
jgi:tRNA threonylcarbamoyladenosine biosynthesis protein TsaB